MLGGTADIRAYDLYVSARALLKGVNQGVPNPRASIARCLKQIGAAVKRDKNFALAWVLKSNAHDAAQIYFPEAVAAHRKAARDAAREANRLEPTLPQAHLELAFKAVERMQWMQAEREFAKASGDEMGQYAYLPFNTGHIKRAHNLFSSAKASDSHNANLFMALIVTNDILGSTRKALNLYRKGRRQFTNWTAGDFNTLVMLWGHPGLNDALARSLARRIPGPVFAVVNRLYGSPPAVMQTALKRLFANPSLANPINHMAIAAAAAKFGDPKLALRALRKACVAVPLYSHKFWQPLFSQVRKLPGFKTFMRKRGFLAYWRRYGWPPSVPGPPRLNLRLAMRRR
jgi:hypothetical protein